MDDNNAKVSSGMGEEVPVSSNAEASTPSAEYVAGGAAPPQPVSGGMPVGAAGAEPKGSGRATAALVCGIAAIVTCINPVLGLGLGIASVLCAGSYFKLFGPAGSDERKKVWAKRGRICGIVGMSLSAVWAILLIIVTFFAMSVGVGLSQDEYKSVDSSAPFVQEDKNDSNAGDDDDVIIANGVDTSSQYVFTVETAVVGMDEYSETPAVVLMAEFTNNSDKTVSFSSALSGTAFQDGYELSSVYLPGLNSLQHENIEPGKTVPVFIGWKLWDGVSDVKITVYDQYHYAKEEVFSQSYTIKQLLDNSEKFASELDGVFDEDKQLAV